MSTFDRLEAEYAPLVDVADPLGFGLKVRAVASDPYKFWRGTKGFFYDWCRANVADWLATPRTPGHGDVHFGNVGTYATGPGVVAFGLIDFDDAIDLPFQIDLLDACITTRLATATHGLTVDQAAIDHEMIHAYRTAVTSGRTATALLADDPIVKRLLKKAKKPTYADELDKFCDADGAFRRAIGKPGKSPSELLEAITTPAELDAIANGLAEACGNDAALAARMKMTDAAAIRAIVRGACRRTRLGSGGSQGLRKVLVRLARPFRDEDGDALLYLKEQIPTAAERAGVATRRERTPGERAAGSADALTSPRPIVNGFCTIAGRSYLVTLKEPWGTSLDPGEFADAAQLAAYAKVMATALGAAHGADRRGAAIAGRLDDATVRAITTRADAYVVAQRAWFDDLAADDRAKTLIGRAEQRIDDSISGRPRS